MKEEENVEEKKEQLMNVKMTEKSYQQLITLLSLKQIEKKRRISVSELLSPILEREIERASVEKERGAKEKIGGNKNE